MAVFDDPVMERAPVFHQGPQQSGFEPTGSKRQVEQMDDGLEIIRLYETHVPKMSLGLYRVQHDHQECGHGTEQQGHGPPGEPAPAFALSQPRVDQRQREPTHRIFSCQISHFDCSHHARDIPRMTRPVPLQMHPRLGIRVPALSRDLTRVGSRSSACRLGSRFNHVAQVCNLPYRRFAIGGSFARQHAHISAHGVHPAGYKPAKQQIENLRYDLEHLGSPVA
jgi:hypothetical protein